VAEVYFTPTGAYAGGMGRIHVYLRHRGMPLLRRQIFYFGNSDVDETTTNYVDWCDDANLFVFETRTTIPIRAIGWETPMFVRLVTKSAKIMGH
jgi:hypothetical protein